MISSKPQQALTPAMRSAGRAYTTSALRSARLSARPNKSLSASAPPRAAYPSQALAQHRSRSTWHRPGCSYAASVTSGAGKAAPRDHTCPACQNEQGHDAMDTMARDMMMQHKRHIAEMRSMFERNPYDSLFGLSNRRLNALWDSHFSFPDIKSFFPSRAAVHSTSKAQTSASPTRRVPVKEDSDDYRASVTWSTSGVGKDGKPFDKSGTLVYDPVTGRMVKTKEEVDHVSTTAAPATVVGQVVHQTLVEEGGSPEIKYARPSTDPEEVPSDKVTKAQQAKIQEIQALESKLEAAKERADTAVGIEKDARAYNWNDPTAKDDIIPSGAPPRNINNELGRMVNLDFDEQGPSHKYVTPTADHPTGPPPAEKFSGSHKESMEQVMQRERELQKMKKSADSAIGVEEDAAAAGWTSDNKPSSVSTTQNHEPRTHHGYSAQPISNAQSLDSGKFGRPTFSFSAETTTHNTTPVSAMDRIKAKEREYEERKRNLNSLKAKQLDMEQSWKREQAPRSTFTSDVRSTQQQWPSPQELDRQARAREEKKDKASAWARFKNATPSKRYPFYEEDADVKGVETAIASAEVGEANVTPARAIPTFQATDPPTEPEPSVPPRQSQRSQSMQEQKLHTPQGKQSSWRAAASSEEPARGYMKDRTPGALSVFTKEKPLKSMSMSDLNRDRASVMSNWKHVSEKTTTAANAADRKLETEIEAQKSAMSWFENKWRRWRQRQPESSPQAVASRSGERPASEKPAVEATNAEGDMAPNVAEFATSDRWYKNKAPHAYAPEAEQQQLRDTELVASIRDIYERAYGTIGKPKEASTETGKKPSVHATLKDLQEVEQEKTAQPVQPEGDYELCAYTRRAERDGEVVPMPAAKIKLLQLSRHLHNSPIDLPQALSQLRDPAPFAKFWARNRSHDEEIVFATRDILVSRVPKSSPATWSSVPAEPSTPSPAAEVKLTPEPAPAKDPQAQHKMRREEAIFTGQLPAQKQSVPEIIKLLNAQGMSRSSGPAGPARRDRHHEHQQRRKDRTFLRGLRKLVLVGGWLAGAAYAAGVVVEYFRAGPSESGGSAAWEDRSPVYRPAALFGAGSGAAKEPTAQEDAGKRTRRSAPRDGYFEDMPLRGLEYPLLGILAGCVWYLISQSP